jgi:uncharacterized membrane protein YgcG
MGIKEHCSKQKRLQWKMHTTTLFSMPLRQHKNGVRARGTHSHACLLSLSHFPTNSSPVVVFTAAMAAHTFYLGAKCGGGAEAMTQRRGGNLAGGGGATPSQGGGGGSCRGGYRHQGGGGRVFGHARHQLSPLPRERERGERRSSWRRGGRRVEGRRERE